MLKGKNLDGMVLGLLEDSVVVGNDSCRDGSSALIYLDRVSCGEVSQTRAALWRTQ